MISDHGLGFYMGNTGHGIILKGCPYIRLRASGSYEIAEHGHDKNNCTNDQSREKSHLNMKSAKHKRFSFIETISDIISRKSVKNL